MEKYKLTKAEEIDNSFARAIRYDLYYGPYDPVNKRVAFSKTRSDKISISYEINIKCDKIDNFAQQIFNLYSFGFKDYQKMLSTEYFDVTGEMVNKYQIKDKFDNEICIYPVHGIIFFTIRGYNKIEDYDFFDEMVVNACCSMNCHMEAFDDEEDELMKLPPCMR